MSSFLKYSQQGDVVQGNGRGRLSFHRAHLDGMPFRGPSAMLREEEYEEYTETVHDGYVYLFDLSQAEHQKKLNEIVDAAANSWYKIFRMSEQFVAQPNGSLRVYVYCVWSEPHKELARHRMPPTLLQQSSTLSQEKYGGFS